MVLILTPLISIVVPREVSVTYSQSAGIVGCPSRSTRRKTMPWSSGAGFTVIVTCTPVCKPLPEKVSGAAIVCCFVDDVVVISLVIKIFIATNIVIFRKFYYICGDKTENRFNGSERG
jgi:hypothetical protein